MCSVHREVCSKASEGKEEAEFLLAGTTHCLTGGEEACSSSVQRAVYLDCIVCSVDTVNSVQCRYTV